MKAIRVLIIEDSKIVQAVIAKGLAQDPEIQVVGAASDPYAARKLIAKYRPDVLTLDLKLPRMDGLQFLRFLMAQFPLPVVVVSALTQEGANISRAVLEAGAISIVAKPNADTADGVQRVLEEIRAKVKQAAGVNVSHWKQSPLTAPPVAVTKPLPTNRVIAIGISTGGVITTEQLLSQLPAKCPGIIIVQHMPEGFTHAYAERLNQICPMEVKEAKTGDPILPGRVLIAPGDQHMTVRSMGSGYAVICRRGEKVGGHCPSVNVLFKSVAKVIGSKSIGIIMTGMGGDGAAGMLEMREAGARTLAQDKSSSVVFGMPLEAYKLGGVEAFVSLQELPETIISLLHNPKRKL